MENSQREVRGGDEGTGTDQAKSGGRHDKGDELGFDLSHLKINWSVQKLLRKGV